MDQGSPNPIPSRRCKKIRWKAGTSRRIFSANVVNHDWRTFSKTSQLFFRDCASSKRKEIEAALGLGTCDIGKLQYTALLFTSHSSATTGTGVPFHKLYVETLTGMDVIPVVHFRFIWPLI